MAGANELIAIELQLRGYDAVMRDFKTLDQLLNGFRGKKNKIEIQAELGKAKQEIIALDSEVKKLKKELKGTTEYIKGTNIHTEEWTNLNRKLEETQKELTQTRTKARELQLALKQFSNMSWMQAFNKISSATAHLGSAMQSAGNALTRLTSPFQRFTSGMVMGAGYKALNKFTEGLESGFTRADTMKKYSRIMEQLGNTPEAVEKSKKALDKAVQGLPTSLDEIMEMTQRYNLSLNDINKSTDLAIATNNAFLASMSTDTQRYQGMLQMQDLLNGKKLTSREWMSLGTSMGLAINEVGKQLGYSDDQLNQFRQDLYGGKIATKDFLDALVAVGASENGAIRKAAEASMDTWQAFFSRIGTAASRMGAGIIESMDKIVDTATNGKFKSLNSLFDDYLIGNIDKMTASIKDWIAAHPNEIVEFGKALTSINWGSIISGFGQALQDVATLIKNYANFFGGKDLSLLGKFMVKGNILGNVLTIFGGLLKGSRHIVGGIFATLFKGGQMAYNIKKFGLMGFLGRMMTIGTEGSAGKEAVDTATKVAPKAGKIASGMSAIFKGWAQLAGMVGGTAFVGMASIKMLKTTIKDLGEIGNLVNEVDWESAVPAMKWFGIFLSGFMALGSALGGAGSTAMIPAGIGTAVLGALTTFASAILALDMKLVKSAFKSLDDVTEYMKSAVDNLNSLKSINKVGTVKTTIQNAITTFNQIKDLLRGGWNGVTSQWEGGLDKFPRSIRKSMENIAETIENMKLGIESLNAIGKMEIDSKGIEDVAPKFNSALSALRTTILAIPTEWKEKGIVDSTGNLSSSLANLKSSFDAIVGKNGILGRIPEFLTSVTNLMHSGSFEALPGKMEVLGDTLKQAYDALNSGIGNGDYMKTNLDNFRQSLKSAKFAIKHLQEISGLEVSDDTVGKIKGIFDKIKEAFNVDEINAIVEPINTLKQAIADALKSFEDLNQDIEVNPKVKLGNGFDSSVNTVVTKINNGKKDINKAVNNIPSNIYKRITVHIIVSAVTEGMGAVRQAGIDAVNNTKKILSNKPAKKSMGGLIYRANGGNIFRPRGTDKIPAMLTEGEYVQKKQAVDFFGLDFMRKVNNMDVRGAMNELLHKAGNATNIGRQSMVTNTVNNNQRVTQNINTNNPNFAGVRMGRFVGAL